MNLFAKFELEMWMVLGVLEVVVVLLVLCIILYRKVRKYRPYYEANTTPVDYIKAYLTKAIDFTRKYASSMSDAAAEGEPTAQKRRKNMVARLNWLVLEKDFVSFNKPNSTYWDDINFRIHKMLQRWTEINFINGMPDDRTVDMALSSEPMAFDETQAHSEFDEEAEWDPESGDISKMGPLGDSNDALKRRVQYLEKQLRKLASYKTLYYGLQNSYDGIQKSYKALKRTLNDMHLNADDAEKLKQVISEHETVEKNMEMQMQQLEAARKRMSAEMEQLEAAYVKLEEEHFEQQAHQTHSYAAQLTELSDGEGGDGDLISHKELFDNYDNILREFRGFLHSLDLETDVKLEIDEHTEDMDRMKEEIKTCVNVLELERERLQSELKTLKGGGGNKGNIDVHSDAA